MNGVGSSFGKIHYVDRDRVKVMRLLLGVQLGLRHSPTHDADEIKRTRQLPVPRIGAAYSTLMM